MVDLPAGQEVAGLVVTSEGLGVVAEHRVQQLPIRRADVDQLTDEERATITNVIDAVVTRTKLRLINGGAG